MTSRFPARTTSDPSIGSWGKPAAAGGVSYGVATGGSSSSITVDSINYTLLTFTSTGTLTVSKAGVFDIYLVAGGGGGGAGRSVGGGGGYASMANGISGYAGGSGTNGGGGGAGGAGSGNSGGAGIQVNTFISGSSLLKAKGGEGAYTANGAANSGDGGGGGIYDVSHSTGGSGIVYIRFKV